MQALRSIWFVAALLAAGCSSEEEPTLFDVGCGVEVPSQAQLNFERLSGECAVLDPIPYDQLDDEDLGCVISEVVSDDGRCDVTMRCEGEVFEGQYYEIDLVFDYTAFPVRGTADLHVYEPDTGEDCVSDYDVWIE